MINIPDNLFIVPESFSSPESYERNFPNRLLQGQLLDYPALIKNDQRLNFLSLYDIEATQIDETGEIFFSRIGLFVNRLVSFNDYEKITGIINTTNSHDYVDSEIDLYMDQEGIVRFNIGDRPGYSGFIIPAPVQQITDGFNSLIHTPIKSYLEDFRES